MTMDNPFDPSHPRIGETEPWECDSCHQLIYNIDAGGYPAPGAPMSRFWSPAYRRVCNVCFSMALEINTPYMCQVSEQEREADAKYKDKIERLNGKRDYFTGV